MLDGLAQGLMASGGDIGPLTASSAHLKALECGMALSIGTRFADVQANADQL